MARDYQHVTWYDCECDWISKYCEDHHRVSAMVPVWVLRDFLPNRGVRR